MAQSVIGALRVTMGLDTAQFDKGTKKAQTGMRKMSSTMNRASGEIRSAAEGLTDRLGALGGAMRGLGPAGIAGAAGIAALSVGLAKGNELALKSIQNLSNLARTADLLDVSAEQLQTLRYAAAQLGVETQELDDAWREWVLRVGEAQAGEGELLELLKSYNIAIRDHNGQNRSATAIYRDLADVVKNTKDAQEQLRIADLAGGDAMQRLVQLLRQGSGALDEHARAAKATGAIIDEEIVQRAADADRELKALILEQEAALARIGDVFNESAIEWQRAKADIINAVADIAQEIKSLIDDTEGFMNRLGGGQANLTEEQLNRLPKAIADKIRAAQADAPVVLPTIEIEADGTPIPRRRPPAPPIRRSTSRGSGGGATLGRTGFTRGNLPSLFGDDGGRSPLTATIDAAKAGVVDLEDLAAAAGNTMADRFADAFTAAIQGAESFSEALRNTAVAAISTIARELIRNGLMGGGGVGGGGLLGSVFGSIGSIFGLGNSVGGGFSVGSGGSSLSTGASGLGLGSSLSGGGGGFSFLSGIQGFRTGGSFQVGGHGGPDSEVVSFKASPGENVSIDRQDGGSRTANININLSGANGDSEIRRIVQQGVAEGLKQYDQRLPGRMLDVQRRHY